MVGQSRPVSEREKELACEHLAGDLVGKVRVENLGHVNASADDGWVFVALICGG